MSWPEKSAGIVMSEIILGNAGVCCKVPGKRQFITSVGSVPQPAHVHTDAATQPGSLGWRWSHALLQPGNDAQRGWGPHLMGKGARELGLDLSLPAVTWYHQI